MFYLWRDVLMFAILILENTFIIRSYFYRIHVIWRKQEQSVRRGLKYITVLSWFKQNHTARILRICSLW